jgi:outer membrane protein OmpA-like peptidoglycan-associated protein
MRTNIFVVAAVAGVLASCATVPKTADLSELPGYSFDYQIAAREAVGVIQAFDDGTKTYIQFVQWERMAPVIVDVAGTAVPYTRSGPYAVTDKRYQTLVIRNYGQESSVTAMAMLAPANAVTAVATRQVAETTAEVDTLRQRVSELETQLAEAKATLIAYSETFILNFGNNSAKLSVDPDRLHALANVIRDRPAIVVSGYTDATYEDEAGGILARRRAQSVKRVLLAEGVPADHVAIEYFAARRFIAPNDSAEGRAMNRRVEIVSKAKADQS